MKDLKFAGLPAAMLASLLAAAFSAPAFAQIGVSLNVGEPNFYGRIDVGGAPPPRLVYRRPVVVQGEVAGRDPLYLHVRPGYERDWRRHCGEYSACDQPVLFVRDDWYRRRYVPHYRAHHEDYERRGHDDHHDHDEHHDAHGDEHHGEHEGDRH